MAPPPPPPLPPGVGWPGGWPGSGSGLGEGFVVVGEGFVVVVRLGSSGFVVAVACSAASVAFLLTWHFLLLLPAVPPPSAWSIQWIRCLRIVAAVHSERATNDITKRVVCPAVVGISVARSRVGDRKGASCTSHEQPRCHEACRRGDTHTRSHPVTTSQRTPAQGLTGVTIVAQYVAPGLLVDWNHNP